MKTLLKTTTGIAALLAGVSMALAQDQNAAATTSDADITCADIANLDEAEAEKALYFLAGVHEAKSSGQTSDVSSAAATSGQDDGTSTQSGSDATAELSTGGTTAGDQSVTEGETQELASDPAPERQDGSPEQAAGTDKIGDLDPTVTAGVDYSATGDFASEGFYQVLVESVMTDCQKTPDASVAEIMSQHNTR